jgi:uncharacterized protein (DUF3820 family)
MDISSKLIMTMVCIVFGIFMIFGAYKKWKFLVDPPEKYWLWYSQSFFKKFFGKNIVILETYIAGICSIFMGYYFLYFYPS